MPIGTLLQLFLLTYTGDKFLRVEAQLYTSECDYKRSSHKLHVLKVGYKITSKSQVFLVLVPITQVKECYRYSQDTQEAEYLEYDIAVSSMTCVDTG